MVKYTLKTSTESFADFQLVIKMMTQNTVFETMKIEDSINSVIKSVKSEIGLSDQCGQFQNMVPGHSNAIRRSKTSLAQCMLLRCRRGKRIFEMFTDHPILSDKAQSRRKFHNKERNKIWIKITADINKEFSGRLEKITVGGTKKLADYWKGRFPRISEIPFNPPELSIGRDTVSPSPPKFFPTPPSTPSKDLDNAEELAEEKRLEALRAERLYFLVESTKQYTQLSGLDRETKCRSSVVNERRTMMWNQITSKLNSKYGAQLGDLLNDQVKKAFSNYKRRHYEEFKHELNNESSSSSVAEEAMEVAVDYKNEDDEDFPMDEDETTQIQRIINYSMTVQEQNAAKIFEIQLAESMNTSPDPQIKSTIRIFST
eukprot:NP_001255059.1 Uncharacterized protein CELE_T16G12.9 [Caenorhabditis elegans]